MRCPLLFLIVTYWSLSNAQNIAAFYSSGGPTVVSLDYVTGNFMYNLYSKNGFSAMKSFKPTIPAKNGTSIACVGYGGTGSVYGAIFYQTMNNSLAEQFFKCSYVSGNCVNYGGYMASLNVSVPVRPGTGISAALLSNDLGYRVSYEDIYGSVRQIGYSNTTKGVVTPWADGVRTSNLTMSNWSALSTTYVQSPNSTTPAQQTIFQLNGDQILPLVDSRATAMNTTQTWVQSPPITNLPSWNPENATFATVIYDDWMMLFYVDMTRQLQWIRSTDVGQTWQAQPLMDVSIWPLADVPNAPVAAATSVNASDNSASVFYVSGGQMIQCIIRNRTWMTYKVVESPNTTSITPFGAGKDTKGIKIGASTGAALGFLIVVAIVCLLHKTAPIIERAESIREKGSEFNGKAELHGNSRHLVELDHDSECLLLHQLQLFRMYEMKGEIPVELQNSEVRLELDHTLCKCELDASAVYELPCLEKERSQGSKKSSVKELPDWSWVNLRRDKEKGDEEMGRENDEVEEKARNARSVPT